MRWKTLEHGTIRTRKKFLWFPLTRYDGSVEERIWLEKVTIEEIYSRIDGRWYFSDIVE